jgi:hypothetical protein
VTCLSFDAGITLPVPFDAGITLPALTVQVDSPFAGLLEYVHEKTKGRLVSSRNSPKLCSSQDKEEVIIVELRCVCGDT